MDHKETQLARYCYSRLVGRTFDERDLYALCILLRDDAPKGSPVRELGDFIAHRRRDRGAFLTFLEDQRAEAEQYVRSAPDTSPPQEFIERALSAPGVYSTDAVFDSLNAELSKAGVPRLPEDLAPEVLLCIMSLLQDVRFIDRAGNRIGELLMAGSRTRIALLGRVERASGDDLLVTLLSIPNLFRDFEPKDERDVGWIPNTALEVVRRDGRLVLESR
jgi:hypothetical protein